MLLPALLLATTLAAPPPADVLGRLEQLERSRPGDENDPGFAVWRKLEAELNEAAAGADAETRLRLEFGRYRAVAYAAATLSPDPAELDAAQRGWIASHENEVVYNEIGGNYLLIADRLWELHGRAKGDLADDIARAAATTWLPGECEGYIPCYVEATLLSEGRYLELHPRGRHAAELVSGIHWLNEEVEIDPQLDPDGRAEALAGLAKMRQLLEAANFADRDRYLRRLGELEKALASPKL